MATLNIDIPSIKQAYYNSEQQFKNKEKVFGLIRPKYGATIKKIGNITNLPSSLIESFIFIESAGNPNASTPYATGLMQLGTATASDTLIKEKGANRLSNEEALILKYYLGDRYKKIEGVKPGQKSIGETFITKDDLLKPEFNILVGSILLKQLIDEFTGSDKKVRMDKVITIYNGGRYTDIAKSVIQSKASIDDIIKILPKESSAYVLKLVGQRGLLETLA
jgi:soluble lytic murein transglycosylase-like protein